MRYGGYDGWPFRVHDENDPPFQWETHTDGEWRLTEYWGPGYKIGRIEAHEGDGYCSVRFALDGGEETKCTTEEEGKEWITMRFGTWIMSTGLNPRDLTLEDLITPRERRNSRGC